MSYAHVNAVELAGYSCSMVAGAYLMVQSGLTQTILFRREESNERPSICGAWMSQSSRLKCQP